MPYDDSLREKLSEIAANSSGALEFRTETTTELGKRLSFDLGRSPNPVYVFDITLPNGEQVECIAYTLIVNGVRRVATRAEALAKALLSSAGGLFSVNPFLLIFDHNEGRMLAVSAATLFGAFTKKLATERLKAAESATFSLSPNFANQTVSMYATVAGDDVYYSGNIADLDISNIFELANKIRSETVNHAAEFEGIIKAIQERLEDEGAEPVALAPSGMPTGPSVAVLPMPPTSSDAAWADGDVKIPTRVWNMILRAIESSPAVLLVGPPGTGKTALVRKAIAHFSGEWEAKRSGRPLDPLWATPDESWTTRELVGGETVADGHIEFRPGWVLRSIAENEWLVLDEANRGDLDRIFGGLLTWLSGGSVSIGVQSTKLDARRIKLGWKSGASERRDSAGEHGLVEFLAGSDWRLLGTYNALDAQRVFRFGAALGRRFVRVPVPAADPNIFAQVLSERGADLPPSLLARVQGLYGAHFSEEETKLGPAMFIGMCSYIRASLKGAVPIHDAESLDESESDDDAALPDAGNETEALAEAYVVHVGSWIAGLEPADLSSLRQRTLDMGALTESDWEWIQSMLTSLA